MIDEAEALEQPTVVHDEPCPEPGDDRRGTRVETPYSTAFVETIKNRWSHGTRYWAPDEEVWWIAEGHEEAVEELVIEHFGGCRVVDEDGNEMLRDQSGDYEQKGFFG